MSSSFVSELSVLWKPLPMVLLGIPCLCSALLSLKLPETTGRSLPETMMDAVELEVNFKLFKDGLKRQLLCIYSVL